MTDTTENFIEASHSGIRLDLNLFWYGKKVGSFTLNDGDIIWGGFSDPQYEKLFKCREEDGSPQFLVNLHPDNAVFDLIGHGKQDKFISSGVRFLTNISISQESSDTLIVKRDELGGKLADFTQDAAFVGNLNMFTNIDSLDEDDLAEQVSKHWKDRCLSRFSGAEIKLPASLTEDGQLYTPSGREAFTHFIKFPTLGGKEGWGVNEWTCLEVSRRIGLPTAEASLLKFDEKMPPALVVERFDIPQQGSGDKTQYLLQDFCTLGGLDVGFNADRGQGKVAGSMEELGKIVNSLSTSPTRDTELLLKRTLLSWCVGDGDMHRKNISMLFEYNSETQQIENASMSPVYDVTSEIWIDERHGEQEMSVKLVGKTKKLKEASFVALAKNMGIEEVRAKEIIKDTVEAVAREAVDIAKNLPPIVDECPSGVFNVYRIASYAVNTAKRFGYDAPEWTRMDIPKGQRGKSLAKTLGEQNYNAEILYAVPEVM